MIFVSRRNLVRIMLACIGLLLAGHVIGMTLKFGFGFDFVLGWVPLFDFDREGNLPALFSSFALMGCALLLALIGVKRISDHCADWPGWLSLAAIFAFIAIDESISIHEQLIRPLRQALRTSGVFYFAWVIPYGAAVVVLIACYARFVFRLPNAARHWIVASAGVFLTGAIGFELIGGYYFERVNEELTLVYALITTTEELLEMIGVWMFLNGLLIFVETQCGGIGIQLAAPDGEAKAKPAREQAPANDAKE